VRFSFRLAGTDDAPSLSKLGAETFTETFGHLYDPSDLALFLVNHGEDRWRQELADAEFSVLIVENEGEAIGYAKVGPPHLPFEPRGAAVELRQFYLLEPWQGQGIADTMMQWVIDDAERRGGGDIYLSVFVNNDRARRFYERWGFVAEGRCAFMVGNHADEDVVMRRPL
jgi:GNAT superfamily N-acetyltransferase